MGSIRTWSLAVVAGILIVVVSHQRSQAQSPPARGEESMQAALAPPAMAAPAAERGPPVRVTGLPDFSELVAQNGASVVNISVVEKPESAAQGEMGEGGDPLSQFFHHHPMPGPDRAPPARGIGSGFIVSSDGYILTNAHVVADASRVTVKLTDRREFEAKVIGVDKRSDVALIKIAATGLPAVRFGDLSRIRPGQWVDRHRFAVRLRKQRHRRRHQRHRTHPAGRELCALHSDRRRGQSRQFRRTAV